MAGSLRIQPNLGSLFLPLHHSRDNNHQKHNHSDLAGTDHHNDRYNDSNLHFHVHGARPVNLKHPGQEALAGTAQQVGSRFPINNIQDCCSAYYLDTQSCVGFTYGNLDNEQDNYPPVLDNPSNVNTCRIYRDVFNNCAQDVSAFDTNQPLQAGEVNSFGFGPCTPDQA